jgi:hypothetical protein
LGISSFIEPGTDHQAPALKLNPHQNPSPFFLFSRLDYSPVIIPGHVRLEYLSCPANAPPSDFLTPERQSIRPHVRPALGHLWLFPKIGSSGVFWGFFVGDSAAWGAPIHKHMRSSFQQRVHLCRRNAGRSSDACFIQ